MVILDRPPAPTAPATPAAPRPRSGRAAPDRAARARRLAQNLPIVLMSAVAALCVGYGIGTLAQYDRDWRTTAPTLVASAQLPVAPGAPLAESLAALLAGSPSPVEAVSCPDGARVGDAMQRVCSARAHDGMVSLVASSEAGILHVDVYAMT
jgi:hypothetical protein